MVGQEAAAAQHLVSQAACRSAERPVVQLEYVASSSVSQIYELSS